MTIAIAEENYHCGARARGSGYLTIRAKETIEEAEIIIGYKPT